MSPPCQRIPSERTTLLQKKPLYKIPAFPASSVMDSVEATLGAIFAPRPPSCDTKNRVNGILSDWTEATELARCLDPSSDEVRSQLTFAALRHFSDAPLRCYINPASKPALPRPTLPPSQTQLADFLSVLDSQYTTFPGGQELVKRLQSLDADVSLWTLQGMGCLLHAGFPRNGGLDWEKVTSLLSDATAEAKGQAVWTSGRGFIQ